MARASHLPRDHISYVIEYRVHAQYSYTGGEIFFVAPDEEPPGRASAPFPPYQRHTATKTREATHTPPGHQIRHASLRGKKHTPSRRSLHFAPNWIIHGDG